MKFMKTRIIVKETCAIIKEDLTPRNRVAIFNESLFSGGGQRALFLDVEIPN